MEWMGKSASRALAFISENVPDTIGAEGGHLWITY